MHFCAARTRQHRPPTVSESAFDDFAARDLGEAGARGIQEIVATSGLALTNR